MLKLAQARWPEYLERISRRYAGQMVILRQREIDDLQSQVVLWRTPLRELVATPRPIGTYILIRAGEQEPYIEISLGLGHVVALNFGAEQTLESILIQGMDGTSSTLLFPEGDGSEEWI